MIRASVHYSRRIDSLSPAKVLHLLAVKLGVNRSGDKVFKQVLDGLQARRHALVVLDNFESIWSPKDSKLAEEAEIFLAQLAAVDELTLIITTRGNTLPEYVGWTNTDSAELDTLSSTAARLTFEDLSMLPPETLSASTEATALTELLREVDFVPLAITLLARLDDLPSRLLREWHDVYTGVLEADRHDGTRRELSVEVSIKISLVHLPSDPQPHRLLSICGYLPSGLFPETSGELQALLPRIELATAEVLRHSLVYIGSRGELKMLSTVRHYVNHHITTPRDDLQALQNLYLRMAFRFPRAQDEHLPSLAALVEHEFPNVLAVLGTMATRPTTGLIAALQEVTIFALRRNLEVPLWRRILPHMDDMHLSYKATCYQALAQHHDLRDEQTEAIQAAHAAEELCRQLAAGGTTPDLASCQWQLSVLYFRHARFREAEYWTRATIRSNLELGDQPRVARASDHLTAIIAGQGDHIGTIERARATRDEALALGEDERVAEASWRLGNALAEGGDTDGAVLELEVAHALHEILHPESLHLGDTKYRLALLHSDRGEVEIAEELLIEAHCIATQLNHRESLLNITVGFVAVRMRQFRWQEAIALEHAAAQICREMGWEDHALRCEESALKIENLRMNFSNASMSK